MEILVPAIALVVILACIIARQSQIITALRITAAQQGDLISDLENAVGGAERAPTP